MRSITLSSSICLTLLLGACQRDTSPSVEPDPSLTATTCEEVTCSGTCTLPSQGNCGTPTPEDVQQYENIACGGGTCDPVNCDPDCCDPFNCTNAIAGDNGDASDSEPNFTEDKLANHSSDLPHRPPVAFAGVCKCSSGPILGNMDNGSGKPANTVEACWPTMKKGDDYYNFTPSKGKCRNNCPTWDKVKGENCSWLLAIIAKRAGQKQAICCQTGTDNARMPSVFLNKEIALLLDPAVGCSKGTCNMDGGWIDCSGAKMLDADTKKMLCKKYFGAEPK